MKVNCPTCKADVEWNSSATFRPFCSKRCQMIDLGEWADEQHAIAVKPSVDAVDPNDLSDEALDALIQSLNGKPSPH